MSAVNTATAPAETFDLESYLSRSVEKVVKDLVKAAAFHPSQAKFMAKYALASRRAASLRKQAAELKSRPRLRRPVPLTIS